VRGSVNRIVVAAIVGALAGSAAVAAPPGSANQRSADPDKIICEKQEVTGSRLQVRRVCLTRAQWADRRLQERQAIDRTQTMQGVSSKGQ
jgi:hypothetical protein